ncbi:hypothetical protein, partial [Burkholderia anthinoferrum]
MRVKLCYRSIPRTITRPISIPARLAHDLIFGIEAISSGRLDLRNRTFEAHERRHGIAVASLNTGCRFVKDAAGKTRRGSIRTPKSKKPGSTNRAFCLNLLGWLMGLEPTTTGITILIHFSYISMGYRETLEYMVQRV